MPVSTPKVFPDSDQDVGYPGDSHLDSVLCAFRRDSDQRSNKETAPILLTHDGWISLMSEHDYGNLPRIHNLVRVSEISREDIEFTKIERNYLFRLIFIVSLFMPLILLGVFFSIDNGSNYENRHSFWDPPEIMVCADGQEIEIVDHASHPECDDGSGHYHWSLVADGFIIIAVGFPFLSAVILSNFSIFENDFTKLDIITEDYSIELWERTNKVPIYYYIIYFLPIGIYSLHPIKPFITKYGEILVGIVIILTLFMIKKDSEKSVPKKADDGTKEWRIDRIKQLYVSLEDFSTRIEEKMGITYDEGTGTRIQSDILKKLLDDEERRILEKIDVHQTLLLTLVGNYDDIYMSRDWSTGISKMGTVLYKLLDKRLDEILPNRSRGRRMLGNLKDEFRKHGNAPKSINHDLSVFVELRNQATYVGDTGKERYIAAAVSFVNIIEWISENSDMAHQKTNQR